MLLTLTNPDITGLNRRHSHPSQTGRGFCPPRAGMVRAYSVGAGFKTRPYTRGGACRSPRWPGDVHARLAA